MIIQFFLNFYIQGAIHFALSGVLFLHSTHCMARVIASLGHRRARHRRGRLQLQIGGKVRKSAKVHDVHAHGRRSIRGRSETTQRNASKSYSTQTPLVGNLLYIRQISW